MLFCSNSAHFSEIQLVCDRRTDRRTDRPTDADRDARTHLKRNRNQVLISNHSFPLKSLVFFSDAPLTSSQNDLVMLIGSVLKDFKTYTHKIDNIQAGIVTLLQSRSQIKYISCCPRQERRRKNKSNRTTMRPLSILFH